MIDALEVKIGAYAAWRIHRAKAVSQAIDMRRLITKRIAVPFFFPHFGKAFPATNGATQLA